MIPSLTIYFDFSCMFFIGFFTGFAILLLCDRGESNQYCNCTWLVSSVYFGLIWTEMIIAFFLFCIKHTKKKKYKNISILCQIKPTTKWYIFSFLCILYKKEKSLVLMFVLKVVFVSLIYWIQINVHLHYKLNI